eukprot:1122033-Pyramimonas_sp.AAC.1
MHTCAYHTITRTTSFYGSSCANNSEGAPRRPFACAYHTSYVAPDSSARPRRAVAGGLKSVSLELLGRYYETV